MCCSWGILKIKLTRLSSNDPQFRVTLQVSNPHLPPTPPPAEPTNYSQDYVCERLESREIRGSRSRCIPFSLCVLLAVDYVETNPSTFRLAIRFFSFSSLIFRGGVQHTHIFMEEIFFLFLFFLVPFFFLFMVLQSWKIFGSETRKIIKEGKLLSCWGRAFDLNNVRPLRSRRDVFIYSRLRERNPPPPKKKEYRFSKKKKDNEPFPERIVHRRTVADGTVDSWTRVLDIRRRRLEYYKDGAKGLLFKSPFDFKLCVWFFMKIFK